MQNQKFNEKLIKLFPERTQLLVAELAPSDLNLMCLSDLGLSSMQALQMVMRIEDAFSIEFKDEDLLLGNSLSIERIMHLIDRGL